jgi:hypothetical protein
MRPSGYALAGIFQTFVAQISNLLYRRASSLHRVDPLRAAEASTLCRLEIGDTAGWKPALRWLGAELRAGRCEIFGSALVCLALALTGCRTTALPPLDFGSADWRLREGQAVWSLPGDRPEIAGELLVATHGNGSFVVQFSKTPFPLVEARLEGSRWAFQLIPEQKTFTGSAAPPARIAWLQLARGLSGEIPSAPWRFEKDENGWSLRNPKTGEAIQGYLEETHR